MKKINKKIVQLMISHTVVTVPLQSLESPLGASISVRVNFRFVFCSQNAKTGDK